MSCSVCIISTKSPYKGLYAGEALDVALVSACYDNPTSLLLMGDGVYQLLAGQKSDLLPRKNLLSLFKSLPLYGIDKVYIDEVSLTERNLQVEQLLPAHVLLSLSQIQVMINQHDRILNF